MAAAGVKGKASNELVRCVGVDTERQTYEVVVPGWDFEVTVEVPCKTVPLILKPGQRCRAVVDLSAIKPEELAFRHWEFERNPRRF